jgi:hypothetical protein
MTQNVFRVCMCVNARTLMIALRQNERQHQHVCMCVCVCMCLRLRAKQRRTHWSSVCIHCLALSSFIPVGNILQWPSDWPVDKISFFYMSVNNRNRIYSTKCTVCFYFTLCVDNILKFWAMLNSMDSLSPFLTQTKHVAPLNHHPESCLWKWCAAREIENDI